MSREIRLTVEPKGMEDQLLIQADSSQEGVSRHDVLLLYLKIDGTQKI